MCSLFHLIVVEILANYKITKDWRTALMQSIPTRKAYQKTPQEQWIHTFCKFTIVYNIITLQQFFCTYNTILSIYSAEMFQQQQQQQQKNITKFKCSWRQNQQHKWYHQAWDSFDRPPQQDVWQYQRGPGAGRCPASLGAERERNRERGPLAAHHHSWGCPTARLWLGSPGRPLARTLAPFPLLLIVLWRLIKGIRQDVQKL